jgi:hypothetical protein
VRAVRQVFGSRHIRRSGRDGCGWEVEKRTRPTPDSESCIAANSKCLYGNADSEDGSQEL